MLVRRGMMSGSSTSMGSNDLVCRDDDVGAFDKYGVEQPCLQGRWCWGLRQVWGWATLSRRGCHHVRDPGADGIMSASRGRPTRLAGPYDITIRFSASWVIFCLMSLIKGLSATKRNAFWRCPLIVSSCLRAISITTSRSFQTTTSMGVYLLVWFLMIGWLASDRWVYFAPRLGSNLVYAWINCGSCCCQYVCK